jgi:hypothetical protein
VSNMDVEEDSLQEIVDKLSLMVLHLHHQNAKWTSTVAVLNERLLVHPVMALALLVL